MKFYIVDNGARRLLSNVSGDFKLKPEREDGCAGLRIKYSGELTLKGTDFDYVHAIELSDIYRKLTIEIYREVEGFDRLLWSGYFTPFTCKWNLQNSTCSFTPTVTDDYNAVIEDWELEKNILDLPSGITNPEWYYFVQENIGDIEILTIEQNMNFSEDLTGYQSTFPHPWPANINAYNSVTASNRSYGFNGKFFAPRYIADVTVGYEWGFNELPIVSDQLVYTDHYILYKVEYIPNETAMAQYKLRMTLIRMVEITLDVNGAAVPPTTGIWYEHSATTLAGLPAHKYVRLYAETLAIFNVTKKMFRTQNDDGSFYFKLQLQDGDSYNRGRWLKDVLQYFLTDFGLTLKSDFFQSNVNPVTLESDNPTRLLQLLQKSDAKNPTSTEPATNGRIKFSDLITDLCNIFNLQWYVTGQYFIMEHVSTLDEQFAIDATGKYNYNKRNYTYIADQIPRRVAWSWMDDTDDLDFTGVPVEYDVANSSGRNKDNTQEIRIGTISTDLNQMRDTILKANVANGGFCLVALTGGNGGYSGIFYVRDIVGKLTGLLKVNGYLSFSNIVEKFWRHKAHMPTAKMNGETTTMLSVRRRRRQDSIVFPYTELTGHELVKTELGWGEIEDAEIDLRTMTITTTLLHD